MTKSVVQVNQNVKTPVTISSVGAAPSPAGSAESLKSFLQDNYLIIKSVYKPEYIVVDLKTGVVRDINTINNFCGVTMSTIVYDVNPIQSIETTGDPNLGYPASWFGDPWYKFSGTFGWDGKGKIFLTSDAYANPDINQIGALGTITIQGTKGSDNFNESPPDHDWVWGPALDLTGLFEPISNNTLIVSVTPAAYLYGGYGWQGPRYGTSRLYLVQVTPVLPHLPINTTNIDDFINPEDEYTWEEKQYDLNQAAIDLLGFFVYYNRAINVDDEIVGITEDGSYTKMSNKALESLGKGLDKIKDALWGR